MTMPTGVSSSASPSPCPPPKGRRLTIPVGSVLIVNKSKSYPKMQLPFQLPLVVKCHSFPKSKAMPKPRPPPAKAKARHQPLTPPPAWMVMAPCQPCIAPPSHLMDPDSVLFSSCRSWTCWWCKYVNCYDSCVCNRQHWYSACACTLRWIEWVELEP